jgi:hypothetical protein
MVTVVKGEEMGDADGEDVEVSLAPVVTPVRTPPPSLVFNVRATVLVSLEYGPQPYPRELLGYTYSTQ